MMSAEGPAGVTLLTLDIEDWSQTVADLFGPQYAGPPEAQPGERVVPNTERLLGILADVGARATCFVLGSVAERFPGLVREIQAAGHEVATHGYGHHPVYTLTPEEFEEDVRRAVGTLEGITGQPVRGYRAPYYSITRRSRWALDVLRRLGFLYDASTFPLHPWMYNFPGWDGLPNGERFPYVIEGDGADGDGARLIEVPATTVRFLGLNLPFSGGGYLRLLPLGVFRRAIREANAAGHPAVLYMHPHDLDAEELRRALPGETLWVRAMRWGLNLGRAGNEARLRQLLSEYHTVSVAEWLATSGLLAHFPETLALGSAGGAPQGALGASG